MSTAVHGIGVGLRKGLECSIKVIANQIGPVPYKAAVSKTTTQSGMKIVNLRAARVSKSKLKMRSDIRTLKKGGYTGPKG